jgi:hypothetical protein
VESLKGSAAVADALRAASHTAAFLSGREAGLQGISFSAVAYAPGHPDYAEHRRGWESGIEERARRIAEQAEKSKTRLCLYSKDAVSCPPSCSGNGHCIDVA